MRDLHLMAKGWRELAEYDDKIVPDAKLSAATAFRECADELEKELASRAPEVAPLTKERLGSLLLACPFADWYEMAAWLLPRLGVPK